jgi:hypothetical protein
MSRQPVRQRPPADDDLQATGEEEKRRLAEAAARTTKPTSPVPQASPAARGQPTPQAGAPHADDRAAYFSGRYSSMGATGSGSASMSPEMIAERRLAELGLPDSLRHCVADLIHILRDQGLGEALAALHNDPAIDRKYEGPIRRLLADVDRDDGRECT